MRRVSLKNEYVGQSTTQCRPLENGDYNKVKTARKALCQQTIHKASGACY